MTQREEELKPCPFCGYEAELVDNPLTGTKTTAQCRSCGASLFWKKWQNRAEKGATPKPEATEVSRAICRLLQQQARIPTKDISQRDRDIKTLIDAIPKPEATEGVTQREEELRKASEALRVLSDAVFNDNGEMSISIPVVSMDDCIKAYFTKKFIDAALATPKSEAPEGGAHEKGSECQYAKDIGMPEHHCAVRCVYEEKGFAAAVEKAAQVAERYDDTDTLTAPKAIASAIRALTPSPVLGNEKEGGK